VVFDDLRGIVRDNDRALEAGRAYLFETYSVLQGLRHRRPAQRLVQPQVLSLGLLRDGRLLPVPLRPARGFGSCQPAAADRHGGVGGVR
jgi:hypothetical protein